MKPADNMMVKKFAFLLNANKNNNTDENNNNNNNNNRGKPTAGEKATETLKNLEKDSVTNRVAGLFLHHLHDNQRIDGSFFKLG